MARSLRAKAEEPPEAEEYKTGSNAPSVDQRQLEKELGAQIRLMRRKQDLSVSDLANAAGISLGMMSKIENGGISASLTTIQSIARALSVPISSLFTSVEERQDCSYVPAGQGVSIERRGTKSGHNYQLLGHLLRGEVIVEPYLITLHEGAQPHTSFAHQGTELIYMLEGELCYRHGGETYHLRPGDTLMFDSGAQHGPEELITHPMRYLSIIIYPRGAG